MTRAQMEARRLEAIPDIDAWKEPGQLARALKISRTTLYRWKQARAAGKDLKSRPAPGRPARLTAGQMLRAIELFHAGPGPVRRKWTQRNFAEAIEQEFGIRFHPDHAGRIMHRLNLVPVRKKRSR
jgi:transposase